MDSAITGNKSHLPTSLRRKNDTTFDKIFKFYNDTLAQTKLSAAEETIRRRWELAWLKRSKLIPNRMIVKRLQKRFGISERTAYDDIKFAEILFGDPGEQNKEAKRTIVSNLIEKAMRKALKFDDLKAFEKLTLRYAQYNDLNKPDDIFAKYVKGKKPVAIVFSTDPEALKKQADELMQGVEDIEFEDMTNESGKNSEESEN